MRNFSRLPVHFLLFFLITFFLGFFAVPVKADSTGFLSLINSYRQQNNLGSLVEDQHLTNAACWFADNMGKEDYFPSDHVDSLGRTMSERLTDFNVSGSRAENIFYTTAGSSASSAFNAWKNSSGHNANMLSSTYTRIGIGRANYDGKWYWVTDFANGSATTMTNQCGVSTKSNPPAAVKKPPPPSTKPNPSPAPAPPPPPTPTPATVATIAAIEEEQKVATKSATTSTKIIKLDRTSNDVGLKVMGVVGNTVLLGGLIVLSLLFSLIVFRLFHHFEFHKPKNSSSHPSSDQF